MSRARYIGGICPTEVVGLDDAAPVSGHYGNCSTRPGFLHSLSLTSMKKYRFDQTLSNILICDGGLGMTFIDLLKKKQKFCRDFWSLP